MQIHNIKCCRNPFLDFGEVLGAAGANLLRQFWNNFLLEPVRGNQKATGFCMTKAGISEGLRKQTNNK